MKDQASTFRSSGEGVDKNPVGGSVDKTIEEAECLVRKMMSVGQRFRTCESCLQDKFIGCRRACPFPIATAFHAQVRANNFWGRFGLAPQNRPAMI